MAPIPFTELIDNITIWRSSQVSGGKILPVICNSCSRLTQASVELLPAYHQQLKAVNESL